MAAKDRDEDSGQLSEEQRISLLEKSVSLNRIVSLLVAVVLIIGISVGLTILIFHGLNKEPVSDYGAQLQRMQLDISAMQNQIQTFQLKVDQLEQTQPKLQAMVNNSSTPAFQKLLLKQEASNQQFLNALKGGMYDLAHMIPGSRTWLEHYNDELNQAIQQSLQRQHELQQIQSGEVLVEPGAPSTP